MPNAETVAKHESRKSRAREIIRGSIFGFPSSFDIRISSFCSRSAHSGNFRQTQHPLENLVRRCVPDLVDTDRVCDVEAAGFRSTQRFQMRAATERFADVVNIGADIKAFAAQHAEIDFG